MTNSADTKDFNLDEYLKENEGRDLKEEDLRYIFEHFVTEKASEERHRIMMEGMNKQTKALEMIADVDKRVCVIEKEEKRRRWLIPVLISTCILLIGIAGTALAYIKFTK